VPDQHRDVEAWWISVDGGKVSAVVIPRRQPRIVLVGTEKTQVGAGCWERCSPETAIADDRGRHALRDFEVHMRRQEDREVVMAVHVDEPRCQREAGGIDRASGRFVSEITDRHDSCAGDADITRANRTTGPVVYGRSADDQVHVASVTRWQLFDSSLRRSRRLAAWC